MKAGRGGGIHDSGKFVVGENHDVAGGAVAVATISTLEELVDEMPQMMQTNKCSFVLQPPRYIGD